MTVFAEFLNTFFAGFDAALMGFGSFLHETAGAILNPLFSFFTLFGDHGLFFILLAIVLAIIPKTRKIGLTMAGAIFIGALITNIGLKNIVDRPRPYDANELFRSYWEAVGHGPESDSSFPSGHATVAFASMTAVFLTVNKRYSWTGFVFAFLIAFSRIYIAVHYPSDVLFGIIIGIGAGIASYYLVKLFYSKIAPHLFKKLGLKKKKASEDEQASNISQ